MMEVGRHKKWHLNYVTPRVLCLRRMKMVCGDYNKCVNQIVIKPQPIVCGPTLILLMVPFTNGNDAVPASNNNFPCIAMPWSVHKRNHYSTSNAKEKKI